MIEKYVIEIDNKKQTIIIERLKTKKLKILITNRNELFVKCNKNISYEQINNFIKEKSKWIIYHLKKNQETIDELDIDKCFERKVIWILGEKYLIKDTDIVNEQYKIFNQYYFVSPKAKINDICKKVINQNTDIIKKSFEKCFNLMKNVLNKKPEIFLRSMTSRWGTCHYTKNKIVINKKVVFLSIKTIEFIIYHELCHFLVQNHSKNFYNCLGKYCIDHRQKRIELNKMNFILKLGK